jgi:hypothetical protein
MRTLLVLVLVAGAIAGTANVTPAVASSRDRVLASTCGRLGTQRPALLVFACGDVGLYVHRLRWSTWGGRVAVGVGEQVEKVCIPFCAAGTIRRTQVTVRLYTRRACPGRTHLYYRGVTIINAAGHRSSQRTGCPY